MSEPGLVPSRALRVVALVLAFGLLAACAGQRLRPDAALLAKQQQRENTLAARTTWSLEGRLAVAGPADGGSGMLAWSVRGEVYRFEVQAPVTGKTWILSGDSRHAQVEGLAPNPLRDDDAARLIERELGWKLPVTRFDAWVRGVRAAGSPADLEFRADGLPSLLVQDGWRIEYLDYVEDHDPPLPRRVFASHGGYKVRLAVQRWRMP
ncbi:MAG: outer membrane lipoprotein LolB [Xanthomonadales bacterium]|nr:outer membrane lipoprotein LolB [Xanthomonadales bacterium]